MVWREQGRRVEGVQAGSSQQQFSRAQAAGRPAVEPSHSVSIRPSQHSPAAPARVLVCLSDEVARLHIHLAHHAIVVGNCSRGGRGVHACGGGDWDA